MAQPALSSFLSRRRQSGGRGESGVVSHGPVLGGAEHLFLRDLMSHPRSGWWPEGVTVKRSVVNRTHLR